MEVINFQFWPPLRREWGSAFCLSVSIRSAGWMMVSPCLAHAGWRVRLRVIASAPNSINACTRQIKCFRQASNRKRAVGGRGQIKFISAAAACLVVAPAFDAWQFQGGWMQIAAACQRVHIHTRTFDARCEPVERKARGAEVATLSLSRSAAPGIRIYLLLIVFNIKEAERKYDWWRSLRAWSPYNDSQLDQKMYRWGVAKLYANLHTFWWFKFSLKINNWNRHSPRQQKPQKNDNM